tara:strand:+ start:275 stop:508 length:234 start_codon:yes stop_codon:yes gene_type:complete
MGKVKNGLKYEDVITRHQPSVMEGDNVNSVDHGKDKYPKQYGKVDLRRDCDKSEMGTKGDTSIYPDMPTSKLKLNLV